MKGYDTLRGSPPSAPPPPYNYYQQPTPVEVLGRQTSPYFVPQATVVHIPQSESQTINGRRYANDRDCCCCCCTCPFWVCCLITGLVVLYVITITVYVYWW